MKAGLLSMAIIAGLVAFYFWPWVIGIFDLWSWGLLGHQVSSIPWESDRGGFLLAWPMASIFVTGFVCSFFGE